MPGQRTVRLCILVAALEAPFFLFRTAADAIARIYRPGFERGSGTLLDWLLFAPPTTSPQRVASRGSNNLLVNGWGVWDDSDFKLD
ncbi:hypothetical protein DAEQUDRAFT_84094 [Daedalea quercina L-15889]|uniref:Uncharacterized protein n=1 Tax=Daedalea quercina L-15889 TaxID=1314783 RepID=A0A165L3F4_9APHY|nr:hypothetical protein DAEQUDRAFT_84094 [Daedalea quercina L-15889]